MARGGLTSFECGQNIMCMTVNKESSMPRWPRGADADIKLGARLSEFKGHEHRNFFYCYVPIVQVTKWPTSYCS